MWQLHTSLNHPRHQSVSYWLSTSLTVALMLAAAPVLTGCGGGGAAPPPPPPAEQTAENAPLRLDIVKIEQTEHIGNLKAEGGKYAVVNLKLENNSKGDITVKPTDFSIRNITDKPEEQYTQSVESNLGNEFSNMFGPERAAKFLAAPVLIHPKFVVEKTVVFALPHAAQPDKYEVVYTPLKLSYPLVGESTEVVDLSLVQPQHEEEE
jgi:hypothetical protein